MPDSAPLDRAVAQLHRLRAEAGHPSYADIARMVSRLRLERDARDDRIGTTTVYDAFKYGRRRINERLVVDIATVLGADDGQAKALARMCRASHEVATPPKPPEVAAAPEPRARRTALFVGVVLIGSLLMNMGGAELVFVLHLPLFLDMVGTAIAAVILGPWSGALVGAATNGIDVAVQGPNSAAFLIVNVAGGLVWGYGVHRFRLGRSLPHFFALSVVVGLVCTAIAVPIIVVVFGGVSPGGHDNATLAGRLLALGTPATLALVGSNLMSSVPDKVLSGFVALVARESVSRGSS